MKESNRKLAFRFSLATLLFIMACVAGYFTGVRQGRVKVINRQYLTTVNLANYEVDDLILNDQPQRTVAQLVELIESTISHGQWQPNGENSIVGYPNEDAPSAEPELFVSATGSVQDEIAALLSELRQRVKEHKVE